LYPMPMKHPNAEKWQKIRRLLGISLAVGTVIGAGISYFFWGFPALISCVGAVLCLALGFWITEILIGAVTGVKKANGSALALLAAAKFAWWTFLFLGAKHLPRVAEGGVAVGLGVFLLAILFSSVSQYGLPRISDGNSS
jgi:hypothetical protein